MVKRQRLGCGPGWRSSGAEHGWRGGREGERGKGRRVRRPGCQRGGGGGMEERRDWRLHVHEAGQRQDSLMSLQATISRRCSDCSDGLVWWHGHQLSLSCSATFAVAGKEGSGGGKEALELDTHMHAHTNRRQERERSSFGSRLLILFRDTCSLPSSCAVVPSQCGSSSSP